MADLALIYDSATGRLAASLVDTAQLKDAAITSAKLGSGQLGSLHIAPAAIISSLIASGAVGQHHILDGQVVSALIASGAIGAGHILESELSLSALGEKAHGSLTGVTANQHHTQFTSSMHSFAHPSALIDDGAVISAKIAALAIGGGHIGWGKLASGKYAAGSIMTADIGDGQILSAKIAATAIGTGHLLNGLITSAKIGAGQVGGGRIGNGGILSAAIAALAIGAGHIAALAIVSGKVASGGLAPLTSGKIWAGGAGNAPAEIDVPTGYAFTELAGNEGHGVAAGGTWEDWDISGIVPAGTKYVAVALAGSDVNMLHGVRKNGSALNRKGSNMPVAAGTTCWPTEVDANRVIECYATAPIGDAKFSILGYWS